MSQNQRSDNQVFLNQKFESVQSLRGIAALFVVMQHICFLQRGSFGVDLFFLISGFIMMYVTQKSTRHFLMKRLIRILPLYYAMTLVSYLALLVVPGLFEQTTASPVYLVKSLLFIPFSMQGATQPLLRVGWTVNYEILFYLLFFISMKISLRYRALICSGLLLALVLAGAAVPEGMEPLDFWTDSILLEFAAGMGLFYFFRLIFTRTEQTDFRHRKALAGGMWVLSILLFAFLWWSYESPAVCALPEVIRWGIPALVILCAVFYAGCVLKAPRWLVKLGDLSFSLYLIHYYPMRLLNKFLGNVTRAGVREILITLAAAAVTIAAAAVCYELVEVRFTGFLRKKLIGKQHQ